MMRICPYASSTYIFQLRIMVLTRLFLDLFRQRFNAREGEIIVWW